MIKKSIKAIFVIAMTFSLLLASGLSTGLVYASPNPEDYYDSLYSTGVDNSGKQLPTGVADPHWDLVGLYSTASDVYTCQRFQNNWRGQGGISQAYRANSNGVAFRVSATTVVEKRYASNTSIKGAGEWVRKNNLSGTMEDDGGNIGYSPWGVTSNRARWISLNKYAKHYNSPDCIDASWHDTQRFGKNVDDVYVFETSFNLNAPVDDIDYNSVKLSLGTTMYVDNVIAVQINGEMQYPPSSLTEGDKAGFLPLYMSNRSPDTASIWVEPGFSAGTPAVTNKNPPTTHFKKGKNTIRVYVRTDYTHMGIMITELALTFDFNAKISVQTDMSYNGGAWTKSDKTTARPGRTLQWRHQAWQLGLGEVITPINFYANRTVNGGQTMQKKITTWKKGTGVTNGWKTLMTEGSGVNNQKYTIKDADVGKNICGYMWADRTSNLDSRDLYAEDVCAYVPYHYPSCDPSKTNCDTNPQKDCHWSGTCQDKAISSNNNGVKPQVRVISDGTAMLGDTVKFGYNISNYGSFTRTKSMKYKAYTFVVKGGNKLSSDVMKGPKSYISNVNICRSSTSAQDARGISAGQVRSGTPCVTALSGEATVKAGGAWDSGEKSVYLDPAKYSGLEAGDQICTYLTVDNWNVINDESAPSVAASNVACVKVGKRPSVQVTGSDSYADGGFMGSYYSDTELNRRRGSFSQYGLLTNDAVVSNFGSGNRTNVANNNGSCKLTFANTSTISGSIDANCKRNLGNAGITINDGEISTPPTWMSSITLNNGEPISIEDIADLCRNNGKTKQCLVKYGGSSDLEITGGVLPDGMNITLFTSGRANVDITDNITVNENKRFSSAVEIPSFNLLVNKGSINVAARVSLLTGNYIVKGTSGTFNTCAESDENDLGIAGKCNNKLKVNGAVISEKPPVLRRTFGSGNLVGSNQYDQRYASTSAEWFNYTPNTWLTPHVNVDDTVKGYETEDIVTMPPRM